MTRYTTPRNASQTRSDGAARRPLMQASDALSAPALAALAAGGGGLMQLLI